MGIPIFPRARQASRANASVSTACAAIALAGLIFWPAVGAWAGSPLNPAWTAESNLMNASLGQSVATAGDVNGDGFSDVVIGASSFSNGQANEGKAFLYLGSGTGLAATPSWTAESNQAGALFGRSVGTAGDVNGDGYDDVIIGAPYYDNGELDEGRVYVYLGSPTGLEATASWTSETDEINSRWGWSAATAGDVNGDGYSEVIVGAPLFGDFDTGAAYAFRGSEDGVSQAFWAAGGSQDNSFFGCSVHTAGDVNGDGFSDVIVGAEGQDNGETDEGRAYVYLGSASGLSFEDVWRAEPDAINAHFGRAVGTAGDTNGDGYSEVIIGAPQYGDIEESEGAAYVYRGSPMGPTSNPWKKDSDQTDALFGASVLTAGDVNGDGYADVLVGAYGYDNGQTNEGAAFFYLGSPTGLADQSWMGEEDQANAWFGFSVSTAGDVNGDGFSDVIIGAPLYSNGQTSEGQARAYHGRAGGLAASPRFGVASDEPNDNLGHSLAAAGDVNGDGYSDFILGVPYADHAQGDEGSAHILVGARDGISLKISIEGSQSNAHLGISVAGAGDVNGDGYSDVIIGAPDWNNGQIGEGRAFVHLGSPGGVSDIPSWTAESNQAFAQLGWSVAGAGDVNGDGFGDVIVGAYQYDNGHDDEGRAYVYLGSASGLATTPAWTAESNQGSSGFGYSVGSAGDVNGDGFSDVIVGCYLFDNGQSNEGRAFVYHGSASGLASAAAWVTESNQASGDFGFSVGSAGDVNGDGYSDVIVGADTYDNGHADEGRAYVYRGSAGGLLTSPLWTGEPNQVGTQYGFSVASAGDVNADGFSDIVVGAPFFDNGEFDEGGAFVYHGSPSGPSITPATTIHSGEANAWLGYAVASMGDMNGDGFSDVIIGAPTNGGGVASGYPGNGEWTLNTGTDRIARQARVNGSAPISLLGRSPQAAFLAKALGRTAAGRGLVRMEIEVKRLGVPFNGQGLERSVFTDTGAPLVGFGSSVPVSEAVFALQTNATYRWRMRIAATSPFFPSTPWLSMPGNGFTETDFRTGGVVIGVEPDPELSAATPLFLAPIAPNPFVAPGEIVYSIPVAGPVRLAVYDVQGRARAVLAEGIAGPGRHVVRWDARSASGARLEAGIYFVRLTAGDHEETRKLILVR